VRTKDITLKKKKGDNRGCKFPNGQLGGLCKKFQGITHGTKWGTNQQTGKIKEVFIKGDLRGWDQSLRRN